MAPDDPTRDDDFAYSQDLTGPKWVARQYIPGKTSPLADVPPALPADIRASWPADFRLVEAREGILGLRRPQIGALHALLGYWTTDPRAAATIVMPTGTGKTDTMVAALVAGDIERLLVLVPSDALRDQLALKFERLGVLPALGLVTEAAQMPVVGRLNGALDDTEDAVHLAEVCNVVVSTPNALQATDPEVRRSFLDQFSHLFIDEAHHVAARTWRQIRDAMVPRPVVQFTATPHRTDGQHLGGHLVYAYPLREAQREGYFSKIKYHSVLDLLNPDVAIAAAAIEHLRSDVAAGLDHILMARAKPIRRAEEIHALYARLAPDLNPVLIHSQVSKSNSRAMQDELRARTSRILVCVDMFGEGYDLPQLKVAALHDPHQSLGITLQFVGRFARQGEAHLGIATVVAARTEARQDQSLRRLYAEDADWNEIVEDLSRAALDNETELDEFAKGFGALPEAVSIHSLTPAMSTVIYRPSTLAWHPERVTDAFDESNLLTYPVPTSTRDNVVWFVTQRPVEPRWGDVSAAESIAYDLFIAYWDGDLGLLYINSSDNSSVHERLAKALTGDPDSKPIGGEAIYRIFHEVQRLTPNNVGLLDARNRARRYTSHTGSDVTDAFPEGEKQTKTQTHIAAVGFLEGAPYSIAGSLKGRIWSHRTAHDIREWKNWCDVVGPKVIDTAISVDSIMDGFIRPEAIYRWPDDLEPLAVELRYELVQLLADAEIRSTAGAAGVHAIELAIGERVSDTDRHVELRASGWTVPYILRLSSAGLELVVPDGGTDADVVRTRASQGFSELANTYGIRVLLEKDAVIEPPGLLLRPARDLPPFPIDRLTAIDWSGVNIRKESWGTERDVNTVQGRMLAETTLGQWDVVVDDDGPGEVADIVALRQVDETLVVRLVHCKFSSKESPGSRVKDLYELVGQAQRSAGARRNIEATIGRLVRRERDRAKLDRSGFVVGDIDALMGLLERSPRLRVSMSVAIAQPGLSANRVTANVLELLSSADYYVSETALTSIEVYCSE